MAGMVSTQGDRLNVAVRLAMMSAPLASADGVALNPAIVNTISDITKEGTVVIIRYRIWVKRSTPQADAEITVVSLRGETLSPKYAPEIMAPAIHPGWNPMTVPMPMKATPIVAMVLQLLPVNTEITPHTRQHITRKKVGLSICNP